MLFRLIFLIAILFGTGIYGHSDYESRLYGVEQSSATNSVDSNSGPDYNSLYHGQFDSSSLPYLTKESKSKISTEMNFSLINSYCLYVWQPPKIV
jgi:hypothetical protein